MKTTTHIRRFANTNLTKNVMKNTKKSVPTKMLRSLTKKRSRFPRKFAILKSTPVILEAVLTQTFILDTLDSVPQATTLDITLGTAPDTTPDTTLDIAPADRFFIFVDFLNTFITLKGHSFSTWTERKRDMPKER